MITRRQEKECTRIAEFKPAMPPYIDTEHRTAQKYRIAHIVLCAFDILYDVLDRLRPEYIQHARQLDFVIELIRGRGQHAMPLTFRTGPDQIEL